MTAPRAAGDGSAATLPRTLRDRLRARPADLVDVFVYVVVLNLAVEYLPGVITEGFTESLLTAVLLKLALEMVIWLKGHVLHGLRGATSWVTKLVLGIALWAVAAGSKLVVLLAVDVVFGSSVSLGGFFSVTLLVVGLLVARAGVRRLLDPDLPAGPAG